MQETEDEDRTRAVDGRVEKTPCLVLVFAHGLPTMHAVPLEPSAVLGREGGFAAMFADDRVSRRHAEVRFDRGRFKVRDLGSRNGTFLNGRRVAGAGSPSAPRVLRVGGALFTFDDDARRYEGFSVQSGAIVAGPRLRAALAQAEHAAKIGGCLLVLGETGTGKEITSRAFHDAPPRREGPFVALNCGAIPEGLAERLLFGAKRGAFSGAVADSEGYLQAAHGGTLFLDEVGEIDAAVQAKLLRVIETREVLPLGASIARRVDLRVCAATHKDLRQSLSSGRFRPDLYYRLAQHQVAVPPLRERLEEIPWLVARELASLSPALVADAPFVEACMLRAWPGNVRELMNEVRRACAMALATGARMVAREHLDDHAGMEPGAAAAAVPIDATRSAIEAALAAQDGNVTAAARVLRMHRTQLYRMLRRFGIQPRGLR